MPEKLVGAPCPLIPKATMEQCDGMVWPVVYPVQDGEQSGREHGYSVCDTCQSRFDVYVNPDGTNPTVLVTVGRARGFDPNGPEVKFTRGEDL